MRIHTIEMWNKKYRKSNVFSKRFQMNVLQQIKKYKFPVHLKKAKKKTSSILGDSMKRYEQRASTVRRKFM